MPVEQHAKENPLNEEGILVADNAITNGLPFAVITVLVGITHAITAVVGITGVA